MVDHSFCFRGSIVLVRSIEASGGYAVVTAALPSAGIVLSEVSASFSTAFDGVTLYRLHFLILQDRKY